MSASARPRCPVDVPRAHRRGLPPARRRSRARHGSTAARRSRQWARRSRRFIVTRDDIAGVLGIGGGGGTSIDHRRHAASCRSACPSSWFRRSPRATSKPFVGVSDITHDVFGHRRRRAESHQPRGARQRRARHRRHGDARPIAAGGSQAGDRPDHVRRDHALRDAGRRAAAGALRLPGVPRDRHRRPVDGEARRQRHAGRRDRCDDHRGLRSARGRRAERRAGPPRRDRAHAACPTSARSARSTWSTSGRWTRCRRSSATATFYQAQSAGHADAHDAGRVPRDR